MDIKSHAQNSRPMRAISRGEFAIGECFMPFLLIVHNRHVISEKD
jgi:hypothetical protein